MSIGEFSSRCGLSPKVLRSYAEAGVLDPAAVDPATGYRYYDAAQLEEAVTVRLLRRAGVGLAEIARFLGAPTLDALDAWECSAMALGVVGNESTSVTFSVGASARQPASSSLVLAPTSFVLASSLSVS